MDSIKNIVLALFGGQITMPDLTTLGVAAYAVVKSITEWFAKKKLIKADKQMTAQEAEIEVLREEVKDLKKSCSLLGNIIVTCYMSSNTIDDTVKAKVVAYANDLTTVSNLELTKDALKILETQSMKVIKNINNVEKEVKQTSAEEQKIVETAVTKSDSFVNELEV